MNMELLEALKAFQQAAHKLDRAWDKVNAFENLFPSAMDPK